MDFNLCPEFRLVIQSACLNDLNHFNKNATNPVPEEWNPEAKIMFIGEAPGFFEDKQGRPFIGQAGRLLDSLLQLIKVRREDVWIGNLF